MHPILARRDRLALYAVAWVILGGLVATALARPGGLPWEQALAVLVPTCLLYGFVCLSSWYVCRATPLRTTGLVGMVANTGGSAVAAGACVLLIASGWSRAIAGLPGFAGVPSLVWDEAWLLFTLGTLLYLLALTIHYVAFAAEESRAAEKRALDLQLLAREAELKTLRAQIDPHFLFNCLHSISSLTATDAAAARRMCLLLAEFLRSSVKLGAQARIPLAEEARLAERYLDIERVRFGPRLVVESDVREDAGACLVPALLLQPLVENAVTHGVAHLLEGGHVRLEAARAGDGVRITVENRCDPDRPKRPRTGVGLQNVRKRLEAQYNGNASIQVTDRPDRFRVELVIPCAAPPLTGRIDA